MHRRDWIELAWLLVVLTIATLAAQLGAWVLFGLVLDVELTFILSGLILLTFRLARLRIAASRLAAPETPPRRRRA